MYNEDETTWFNQKLLSYKDLDYNTNSTIELSLTSNTKNYKDFSSVSINIAVISGETKDRKVCTLSYIDVLDITSTFASLGKFEDLYDKNIEFARKYKNNRILKISFKKTESLRAINIGIFNSNTDYIYIYVNNSILRSILYLLKNYTDNFINMSCTFANREITSNLLDEIRNVKNSINSLPSSLVLNPSTPVPQNSYVKESSPVEVYDSTLNDELKDFLGGNEIENIKMELVTSEMGELLQEKENIDEIKSELINKILDNKIENIEEVMNSISVKHNPLESFVEFINDNSSYKKLLSNCSEDEFKGITYASKLLYSSLMKDYLVNGNRIPSGFPIIQYLNTDSDNSEIIYDLYLIMLYVKNFREIASSGIVDDIRNKSCLYMSLRCFLDPIIFSYINNKDLSVINSNISMRYKCYERMGFFKGYNKLLSDNKLRDISLNDIIESSNKMHSACLSTKHVKELTYIYNNNKKFILPFENNFTIDQILDEVIFIEVLKKLGEDMTIVDNIKKYISNPSEQLIDLFSNKGPVKESVEKAPAQSNLFRYVSFIKDQIPEDERDKFLKVIETEFSEKPFDFKKYMSVFKFEKFSTNLLRALYIWDPINNKKTTKSYKDFFSRVEESIIDMDMFLANLANEQKDVTSDQYSSWVENIL